MSIKKKDFIFSNTIVVVFTIIIVLILNNFLTVEFGFSKENFFPITIFLVVAGAFLYNFLSAQLLEPLFSSEQTIQNKIKETLHELNTPVATISMNTKMLKKKITDEKNRARLDRIEQSCENLLELYNQMEYEIKTQIDNVNSELFSIDEIIKQSCDKFKDIKKDITIINQNIDLNIEADKNGFSRLIDNLISNGIKYNKNSGSITIKQNGSVLIISDTGIGMDTKNLFVIFDRYYQENSTNSGMGLGLNIVKSYCDRYKIDIKIESKLDVGTTFYLDLKEIIK